MGKITRKKTENIENTQNEVMESEEIIDKNIRQYPVV